MSDYKDGQLTLKDDTQWKDIRQFLFQKVTVWCKQLENQGNDREEDLTLKSQIKAYRELLKNDVTLIRDSKEG